MKTALASLAALAIGVFVTATARAECISDCTDDYQEAMAACQQKFSAPGQEVQLQSCEDDAQTAMESCTNECEEVD